MKWCQFRFIIQMRKKANLLKSNRGRIPSTSLNDLVTQSEHTMSSQASIYTNTAKNTRRNNNMPSASSQDFDDYEDIIADDIDTLFITPEEERKIQGILEFARKGKINPGNAFEIPVRVIDPQLTEGSNMRFWKFASELLFASMSIYDKRVENMFQTTNRMFDNLIRVQGQPNEPLNEEENEERSRRQRGELIQMDVADIGKVQSLSSYEIGTVNCEEADRINIKNMHNQFLPDPLFQKRLQAFDSNTLKSLFLNAFETGTDLQVTFFNNDQQRTASGEVKMDIEGKEEEGQKEEEMSELEERVPKFITAEIDKFNINLGPSTIFNEMSNFRRENIREALQNNRFQVKDFVQELKLLQKQQIQNNGQSSNPFLISESDISQSNTGYSFQQGENEFNFQFNVSEHTQFSEQQRADSQSMPNTYAYSQRQTPLSQFYLDDDEQNKTQMNPWELQFKGMALQKRIRKNLENKRQKKPKGPKNKAAQELDIDFMDGKKQSKAKIFTRTKHIFTSIKDNCPDINVQPRSMHVFTEALKKKRNMERPDSFYLHRQVLVPEVQSNNNQQLEQNQQMGPEESVPNMESFLNIQPNFQEAISQQTTTLSSNLAQNSLDSQEIIYRSTGIRNIRQIKQKIYKHIQEGRRVRLSQLNMNISPSSILIVFLHLVNQNDINITSIDDEHDIEISPRMS